MNFSSYSLRNLSMRSYTSALLTEGSNALWKRCEHDGGGAKHLLKFQVASGVPGQHPMPLESGSNWLNLGMFFGSGIQFGLGSGAAQFINPRLGFPSMCPFLNMNHHVRKLSMSSWVSFLNVSSFPAVYRNTARITHQCNSILQWWNNQGSNRRATHNTAERNAKEI